MKPKQVNVQATIFSPSFFNLMNKLFLAGLLAVSSLAYAGSGTPKAKTAKGKAKTNCTASCVTTASCKPGCAPSATCLKPCK